MQKLRSQPWEHSVDMEPPSDPWDWTVNDVVEQFCRRRSLLDKRPNAKFPDSSAFEQIIRENGIDGSTMLLDVDKASLKELGITKLGELSAIQYAVQLLRHRSPQYQAHVRNEPGQLTNSVLADSHTLATSPSQQDINTYFPSMSSSIAQNPLKRQPSEELAPKQTASAKHSNEFADRLRVGETYVEDGNGRKRRRLELHSSFQPTQLSPGSEDPIATSMCKSISYISPSRDQICGVETDGRFLARKKLLVDDIFFGQTKPGEELNTDVDTRMIQDDRKTQDFIEVLPFKQVDIEGHQNYVYRQILHIFNASIPTRVNYGQQKAQVITPYRSNLVTKDRSPSHILLNLSERPLRAIRIDELDLHIRSNYDNTDYEDWDFMRRLNKDKDMVLPAYGESNFDEQEYDPSFVEELEMDNSEEAVEGAARKGTLTKMTVSEIIDERIDYFVQDWSKRKLPLREATAWRLWKQGKSAKDRISLVKIAEKQIQLLTQRLEKFCTDIADHCWSKEDNLRRQCVSLEETVVSREEQRFKVKVWQAKKAPHHPVSVPRIQKKKPASVHASDEDGILLSSESDMLSNELSNFIDHDKNPGKAKQSVDSLSAFSVSSKGDVGGCQFDGGDLSPRVDAIADTSDMELDPDRRAGLGTSRPPTPNPETLEPKHPRINVIDLTQATSTDSDEPPLIHKDKPETSLKPPSQHILNCR